MNDFADSPIITLTVVSDDKVRKAGVVTLKASRLLSYEQQLGFTRLRVSGHTQLDVREGTDEIDRRLRMAAAQANYGRQALPMVANLVR